MAFALLDEILDTDWIEETLTDFSAGGSLSGMALWPVMIEVAAELRLQSLDVLISRSKVELLHGINMR